MPQRAGSRWIDSASVGSLKYRSYKTTESLFEKLVQSRQKHMAVHGGGADDSVIAASATAATSSVVITKQGCGEDDGSSLAACDDFTAVLLSAWNRSNALPAAGSSEPSP